MLATSLSGCFSAPPQIVSLDPNRGSAAVLADTPVRIVFDQAVVRSSVAGRFSVAPTIPGCDLTAAFSAPSTAPCWIHWLPGDTGLELVHEQAVFAPATRYEFTLSGGFSDLRSDTNNLDHHWDLTSAAAPKVTGTTPSEGATGVAVDTSLVVTFSNAMDPPSTAAAITLQPTVPGTRVVGNPSDHSRFVVLPGRMLDPQREYTISVGGGARGEDNQALATGPARSTHFTTGERFGGSHAVVLAGVPGEAPTEVLLPALAPAAASEPVAAPVVIVARRCALSSCGAVAAGAPLETYRAAAIAPDAAYVAIVVEDMESLPPVAALEIVDTLRGVVIARFPGAGRPSWSPTGSLVAFASGTSVEVFDAATGTTSPIALSTPLLAAPLWSGPSTLVLSSSSSAGSAASSHIEVVDRLLDARYDLPSAPPGTVATAISPNGDQLAVTSPQGETEVIPIGGAAGAAQRPAGVLYPVGFTAEGTVFAVSHTVAGAQLVRVNVVGGDSTTVAVGVGLPDLATVQVAQDGRRIALLGLDDNGVQQAYVANADGTGTLALTRFLPAALQAEAIDFAT